MTRLGMADGAWLGKARRGVERRGSAGPGKAGNEWQGMVENGDAPRSSGSAQSW